MAVDRIPLRATAASHRRPVVSTRAPRSADTPRAPARALQERLGNRATQAQFSKNTRLPAKVSRPRDPAELEAEATARKVIRMQEPPAVTPVAPRQSAQGTLQRAEAARAGPRPAASVSIPGGSPLPASVRSQMEPRFGASFGHVRVHTGESAQQQAASVSAQAFTVGENIFFAKDKFQPQSSAGRELIAHELTHTIQQNASVQRSVDTQVTQHSEPRVQRLFGVSDALEWIADKANYIPGFRLLTIVLGVNPITFKSVDRSAANILRALMELIPVVGPVVVQLLDKYGIFAKVGAWMEEKVRSLGLIGSALKAGLDKFLDSLSWRDILHLGDVYDRGKRIFTDPIDQLIALGKSVITDILGFIRDAVLMPLAKLAEGTRGYGLLRAVLGKDPITGQPVPRTAETLIGGFMKFIGQEEVWENIKKANAIARASKWFDAAVEGLVTLVKGFPDRFLAALESLEVMDFVILPKAFAKVFGVFGGFALDFLAWGGNAVWNLLEIIFDVVSPETLRYIKKTGAAIKTILKDPMPFMSNLVKAAKLGFNKFSDGFVKHLQDGLIDWLTDSLPGVYIPKAIELKEIAKFVFSVMGLSWANIRQKLVKATNETTVKAMETGFDIVVALVRDGPAAAWDKIKEQLANLKDAVIGGITDFVTNAVVKKAVKTLVSMFIPGAGFISAILAIYDAIMVFVRKIAQIVQVVTSFVNSLAAIAAGKIDDAAERVERVLAGLLTLAINFLAGFAGLGKVSTQVMAIVNKIRAQVDKAIDWLVGWIVAGAKKLGTSVAQAGLPKDPKERLKLGMDAAVAAVDRFAGKKVGKVVLSPLLAVIKIRYGFSKLEVVATGADWWVAGSMSPETKKPTKAKVGASPKPVKPEYKTEKLGKHLVGIQMNVDWLGPGQTGGSPPGSSQQALIDVLVTASTARSAFKFVRGHLLNEKLGGPGLPENLFPITANANKQHQVSTEDKIKNWLDEHPSRYVWYEVKVTDRSWRLDAEGDQKSAENYVKGNFECRAKLKTEEGKIEKDFQTTIQSEYKVKHKAAVTDLMPPAGAKK